MPLRQLDGDPVHHARPPVRAVLEFQPDIAVHDGDGVKLVTARPRLEPHPDTRGIARPARFPRHRTTRAGWATIPTDGGLSPR